MAIIKSDSKTLRDERRENARLKAQLAKAQEKVSFLGALCDVDIDALFDEEEVTENGEE